MQVLAKLGERLGDVQVQVPPPGAAAAAAAAAAGGAQRPPAADVPEIDNLFDAAKYGDLEAVEDFIAIGKVRAAFLQAIICRIPLCMIAPYKLLHGPYHLLLPRALHKGRALRRDLRGHVAPRHGRAVAAAQQLAA
jgi:hypothetical protein